MSDQLIELGFDDIEGARHIRERLKALRSRTREAEQASIVAPKIVALVQLVDQRLHDHLAEAIAVRPSLLARALDRLRDLFTGVRPSPEHSVEHRQLELERDLGVEPGLSDLVLDHALAVFELPETLRERVKAEIAIGHKATFRVDGSETSEGEGESHRLRRGSAHTSGGAR